MASGEGPTYCLCSQPYDITRFMIQCDVCKDWFHGNCVGLREYQSFDIDKYHCPRCEPLCGPSKLKKRTNWHRHDYTEVDADKKPVQTGTAVFIKELKSRHFASADSVILRLRGQQLTLPHLTQQGFNQPIVIERPDGLGLHIPPESFTVQDVENYVGLDFPLDVIDVGRQADIKMAMHEFVEYYTSPNRAKVFNCISLEFSKTTLSALVEAPYIARKLDWVNTVWPRDLPEDFPYKRPEVQKYCLMGVKDSYTDFHIDFGGTSVWYHILTGEKIFYIIEPTAANLSLYQRWMLSSNQAETFFADQVDRCYRLVLKQGQTLCVPTGWIHAVLTPVDSIVFGGNFLHSLNIAMQLQVYEIERKIKIPDKYRFPSFETVHWFAASKILNDLKDMNDGGVKCPLHLLQGVKALVTAFKVWMQDKDKIRREEIPEVVQSTKLLKDLSKEIRHAEKYLISLNPPKPERESKRQKKKPLDKDFVDISQPHTLQSLEESIEKTPPKITIKTNKLGNKMGKQMPAGSLKLTLPKPPSLLMTDGLLKKIENIDHVISQGEKNEHLEPVKSDPLQLWKAASNAERPTPMGSLKVKLPKVQPAKQSNSLHVGVTKTIHRKGIKLKVKNIKDVAQELQKELGDSVYEFQEDSDNEKLMIDERPKKLRQNPGNSGEGPLKLRLSINGRSEPVPPQSSEIEVAGEVDVVSEGPKNGIEELLKATEYAEVADDSRLDELDQTGRASPSTREAIAGMLSISQAYLTKENSPKREESTPPRPPRRRKAPSSWEEDMEDREREMEENMEKVHQDEEFIYPSLEASDEEDFIFKPRGRRKEDEAWNPKARVGPMVPKMDRPVREGTRRQAVEKGLEAAAAKKNSSIGPSKRTHSKKKTIKQQPLPEPQPGPSTSILALKKPDLKATVRRPKKGMATAKQRLGKILKIHKMIY